LLHKYKRHVGQIWGVKLIDLITAVLTVGDRQRHRCTPLLAIILTCCCSPRVQRSPARAGQPRGRLHR